MAKKIKITKKEVPVLKRDLNIDESIFAKLVTIQNEYKTRFKDMIEADKKEALEKYAAKIDSLTKEKAKMLKDYNAEIKKYKAWLSALKKTSTKAKPKTPKNPE